MTGKDLIVTPIVLLLVYTIAFIARPKFTNGINRRYFIPALSFKIFGALVLGLIYQFYYTGGDTFSYFRYARYINEILVNDPWAWMRIVVFNESFENIPEAFDVMSRMYWTQSTPEFMMIRIVAILGVFSFNTYSSIAIFFAIFSFLGSWALYTIFFDLYPRLHKQLSISILFLPSVIFWGSGLMKDTLMMGAVGFTFYSLYKIFIAREKWFSSILMLLGCLLLIYEIRIYILIILFPLLVYWLFMEIKNKILNKFLRKYSAPLIASMALILGYFALINVSAGDRVYDIDKIAKFTEINASYLYRRSLETKGSVYYLGKLDGSYESMILLSPAAFIVTFFRPFLWEVKNPLMFIVSIEALFFLLITASLLWKPGIAKCFKLISNTPVLIFCFSFSLLLGVAVGLNSNNFGTLARYKISAIQFYLTGIFILKETRNRQKKLEIVK